MIKYYKKIEITIKQFLSDASQEISETKEASVIIGKYAKGHKLTKIEKLQIRQQTYDVLKGVGIGIPFLLVPGASIILPFMIRIAVKYDIDVLPSSFTKKSKNK